MGTIYLCTSLAQFLILKGVLYMSNKSLQETKQLNAQARANSTPDGKSKISLTQGTGNYNFASSTSSFDLEEAKKLNQQSREKKTLQ